jgi:hypothetical protein
MVSEAEDTMQRKRPIGFVVVSAMAWVVAGSAPALAQPNVSRSALTVGAALGVSGAGSSWSGGGTGPLLSGYVEVPVDPAWRVRLSGGRMRWTPSNEPHDGGLQAGRVSLTYAGVAVTRSYITPSLRFPVGMYGGVGVGYYFYRIRRGPFGRPGSAGVHAVGGIEYQQFNRDVGVRVEVQFHAARGPEHAQVWAYTVPALSASVGISKRF